MIQVQRFRHATEDERRRGLGPMVARTVTLDIAKSEAIKHLRKCIEHGVEGLNDTHVASLDAGRPVPEVVIRTVFDDGELAEAFIDAEPDPVSDRRGPAKERTYQGGGQGVHAAKTEWRPHIDRG